MTPAANGALQAERIPGARLEIFPHGRHVFFDEFSSEVNPVVLGFLESHRAR
jgi:pimeloyl-ACP methyl ester carboxylesterase